MIPVPAMLLVAQMAMPVADRAPALNMEPTCRGAATGANMPGDQKQKCLEKEKQARAELDRQWASFPGGDRGRCVLSTTSGGIPSYVQLLTCLETAKQVRDLANKSKDTAPVTTGQGVAD